MRIRGYAPATPCWAELVTADRAGAASFYAQLFDWKCDGDRFLLHDFAVAGLAAGTAGLTADTAGTAWLTHLSTDDLDLSLERITAAGGRCADGPVDRADARSALVEDPSGAEFGLWQRTHRGFAGAAIAGEPGATCWAELRTSDPLGEAAFYARAFDWVLRGGPAAGSDRGEWLTAAHDSVAALAPAPAGARASWRSTFQVEDCGDTATQCERLGGTVVSAPAAIDAGVYAELTDPFGAVFGVVEPFRPGVCG